jgi:hypothetical protein
MITNYYPWNVQVLASWLRLELTVHRSPRALAMAMQVSSSSIRAWLSSPVPTITLAEICAIAQYHSWSLQQTIDWLGLQSAHVESLISQDPQADRISWSDAKGLWFGKPVG